MQRELASKIRLTILCGIWEVQSEICDFFLFISAISVLIMEVILKEKVMFLWTFSGGSTHFGSVFPNITVAIPGPDLLITQNRTYKLLSEKG